MTIDRMNSIKMKREIVSHTCKLILGSIHGREAPSALSGLSESSFVFKIDPVISLTTPLVFMG